MPTSGSPAKPLARTLVTGDPQGPFDRFLAILDRHGALAGDRLAEGVHLVSIGDHFDYDQNDPAAAGREGLRLLRWLSSHDTSRVTIVAGNHDLARVIELAGIDDARFADARALALSIEATKCAAGEEAAEARERNELATRFPEIATYGLVARDYASFSVEQRDLVRDLLLAGRMRLAVAGALADGRRALLTHAGVTSRELALLTLADERDPSAIAAALDRLLREAVEARRDEWARGLVTPLSLEPLHVGGRAGEEGGGLLYHRPSCPDRPGVDRRWELDPTRPRRFDPRTLPRGLTQIAGHTGHHKCLSELGDRWPTAAARARAHGGIRTLRVLPNDDVIYDLGVLPASAGATDLILVDGEMRSLGADEVDLLALASIEA